MGEMTRPFAWNFWWVKHAILNLETNPLSSDYMFHPLGINLAFYTLTLLNALGTALPWTLNLGVVTASNMHMLFLVGTGPRMAPFSFGSAGAGEPIHRPSIHGGCLPGRHSLFFRQ